MKKDRLALLAYLVLRLAVVAVLVLELLARRWTNVFLCVLTLVLFMVPTMVERHLKVDLPDALEIVILLFIFAAEILGEIAEFYVKVDNWDTMLHTVNGFLMTAIGFALIDVLNRSPRFHISLSPVFVAFVAFCFSMTVGVFWEFFEYVMDKLLLTDMQKDYVLRTVSSVTLHPAGANIPVVLEGISQTIIRTADGAETVITGGYLDIGINDTMKDLLVNCLGALVFSTLGAAYIRHRRGIAQRFIPTMMSPEEATQVEEQVQAERTKRIQRRARRRKK